jgi:hypothetical protein
MPPIDPFAGYPDSVISQGRKLKQITPHDVNDLPIIPALLCKALFCTVAGTFDAARVKRVYNTGTTATVFGVL